MSLKIAGKSRELPKAYLQVVVRDTAGKIVHREVSKLSRAGQGGWQELTLGYKAQGEETAEVSLVNGSNQAAYFDNLTLVQEPPLIVQENHYDPWGLNLAGTEQRGNPDHKYQYNGKEKQDELGLNWTAMDFRQYDMQLGRFHAIDPLASNHYGVTPFAFVLNNPLLFADPTGLDTLRVGPDGIPIAPTLPAVEVTTQAPSQMQQNMLSLIQGYNSGSFFTQGDRSVSYGWSKSEIDRAVAFNLTVASMFIGGPGLVSGVRAGIQTIGWGTLRNAAIDASIQFTANFLESGDVAKAASNVNLLETTLAGLGVNPLSVGITSAAFGVSYGGGFQSTLTGEISARQFMGVAVIGSGMGILGNQVGNMLPSLPGLRGVTTGIYMRTALGAGGRIGNGVAAGFYGAVTEGIPFGMGVVEEYSENQVPE